MNDGVYLENLIEPHEDIIHPYIFLLGWLELRSNCIEIKPSITKNIGLSVICFSNHGVHTKAVLNSNNFSCISIISVPNGYRYLFIKISWRMEIERAINDLHVSILDYDTVLNFDPLRFVVRSVYIRSSEQDVKELEIDNNISINQVRYIWTKPKLLGINIYFSISDNVSLDIDISNIDFLVHDNSSYPWVDRNRRRIKVSLTIQITDGKEKRDEKIVEIFFSIFNPDDLYVFDFSNKEDSIYST